MVLLAAATIGCNGGPSNLPKHADTAVTAAVRPAANRVAMASGLVLEDLKIGDGPQCLDPNAAVDVRFTAMLKDGTVFESTDGRGPERVELKQAIRGWQDGIPGMHVGGIRRLTIPWQLGYGDRDVPVGGLTIPRQSGLVFEIELVGLH